MGIPRFINKSIENWQKDMPGGGYQSIGKPVGKHHFFKKATPELASWTQRNKNPGPPKMPEL